MKKEKAIENYAASFRPLSGKGLSNPYEDYFQLNDAGSFRPLSGKGLSNGGKKK